MTEKWRLVVGFGDCYWVSNQGRVGSFRVRQSGAPKILKAVMVRARPDDPPRLAVSLRHEGETYRHKVHVLVANAFLPTATEGQTDVRHIDGDPLNCRADNLIRGTRKENMADAQQHGRTGKKLDPAAVLRIRADTRATREIAAAHQVSGVMVRLIKTRKAWAWVPEED